MFSYLETAKEIVSEDIYQLGLKEYLVGNVLEYISADLVDWRKYEVKGRSVYEVVFPLLHKLTPRTTWSRASENLKNFAQCSCEYFDTFGTCKHIVAVCAAVDKEIKPRAQEQYAPTPLLSRVLEVNEKSQLTEWYNEIIDFLELKDEDDIQNASLRTIYEPVRIAFASPYVDQLVEMVQAYIVSNIHNFSIQKRLVKLALFTRAWLVGGRKWWDIFLPFLSQLQENLQIKFWTDFWKEWPFYSQTLEGVREELEVEAEKLSEENKQAALQILDEEKVNLADRLEFAQFICYYEFVLNHLPDLDIQHLLKLLPKVSEHHMEIEYALSEQIKTLSDFLTSKEEPFLITSIRDWKESIPDSEVIGQVVTRLKKQHFRRKKLLKQLDLLS